MFVIAIVLMLCLVVLTYFFLTCNLDYWTKRGVNGPKPLLVVGNFRSVLHKKRALPCDIDDIYCDYKKTDDYVGIFSGRSPQLLIINPALARKVYVTNFKNFHDNEISTMVDESKDFIIANNPFALAGDKWKERRAEVTPGLTMSRIKTAYPITNKICKKMTEYIRQQIRVPPKDGIDTKELCCRYTSEVVTDCVLGLNADSFAVKPTPIFGMFKKLFDQSFGLIIYIIMVDLLPILKNFYKVRFVPKPIETFFMDLMQNAIDIRRTQEQKSEAAKERSDYLNYMLHLQEKKHLSTKHITAHTMTFLLDGFDTTATATAHCLLLLARNPVTLENLRAEIEVNLTEAGVIDFDKLIELPYLDACVHESLRLFPAAFFTRRICTEPIEFTNKNGNTFRVEKGQVVVLPAYSFMRDADYYENPEAYQPERFLEENGGVKKYRDMGLYYGFGDGPRTCLGMRFALVQVKAAIVEILNNFNISVNPKTRIDNFLDPTYFISSLDGGVWLNFENRHK